MTEMRVEGDFGGHLRHKCEACGVTPVRYDFSVCDKCADAAGWCPHCHQTGGTHDEDCPNRTWSR